MKSTSSSGASLDKHDLTTGQLVLRALPGLILLALMLVLSVFLMRREHKETAMAAKAPRATAGQPPRQNKAQEEVTVRESHMDNIKAMSIIFVVCVHFVQGVPKGVLPREAIVIFVHSFGNPIFAVVSGAVSHNELADLRYRHILHLMVLFLVAQIFYSVLDLIVRNAHPTAHIPVIGGLEVRHINTFRQWAADFAGKSFFHLWYIKALFFWRLAIPCISQLHGSLGAATVLGILVSYCDHENGDWPRAVSFFPFFVLGFWMKKHRLINDVHNLIEQNPKPVIGGAALLMLVHVAICVWLGTGLQKYPWEAWLTHTNDATKLAVDTIWAPFIRLAVYLYQSLITAAIWILVPQTSNFLTACGARTLPVYVLHPAFIYLAIFSGMYDDAIWGGSVMVRLLQQIVCLSTATVVVAFLGTRFVWVALEKMCFVFGVDSNGWMMRPLKRVVHKHNNPATPRGHGP